MSYHIFQPSRVIKHTINNINSTIGDKDFYIECNHEILENTVLIGDPYRLKQVLTNLLSNTVKFTEHGGIKILTKLHSKSKKETVLEIIVNDQGIGIPEEKLNSIFESFKQVDSITTRKFGGNGLGLVICKELVEKQGGNIGVNSNINVGSSFTFTIPYKKGTEDELPVETNKEQYDLTGKNILIVEDHPMNQVYAESMLNSMGAKSVLASNGNEALTILAKDDYYMILMDIQIPIMGGVEALQLIKKMELTQAPIIALTANALKRIRKNIYPLVSMTTCLNPF